MDLPGILNVLIGLVLLFFLLSTLASLLVELLTTVTRYREEILQVTIQRLLLGGPDKPWQIGTLLYDRFIAMTVRGGGVMKSIRGTLRPNDDYSQYSGDAREVRFLRAFWEHPTIRSLVPNEAQAPAALAADTFAQVLMDLAVPKNTQGEMPDNRMALDRALAQPSSIVPAKLRATLRSLTLASEIPAGATGEQLWHPFRTQISSWYGEATRQATEIYRAKMKRLLFYVGVALALALNADAVRTIRILSQDKVLREKTAAIATALAAEQEAKAKSTADPVDGATRTPAQTRMELRQQLEDLRALERQGFPIGWTETEWNSLVGWEYLLKLLGLLATGLAVAQGGPFWYDLMQKLVGLRKGAATADTGSRRETGAGSPPPSAQGSIAPSTLLPLEIGYDLTTPATGFSARKAYWLARASAAAYSPEPEVKTLIERNWHFHEFEFFDAGGSQGFLAADDKIVLVAFRGTELTEIRDALDDANVAWNEIDATQNWKVHSGFRTAFGRLEEKLITRLTALEAADPGRQVYLTGHSLGGGMATVMFGLLMIRRRQEIERRKKADEQWERDAAAARAKTNGKESGASADRLPERPAWRPLPPLPLLYTFGCPRVGDRSFAQGVDKLYPGRIFRLENSVDIVPQLPPPADYHHVGRRMRFNDKGEMEPDVSGLSLVLDEVAGLITKTNLKLHVQDKFAAHGIAQYVTLCEALAKHGN
jgi:triacylglycerol lipase